MPSALAVSIRLNKFAVALAPATLLQKSQFFLLITDEQSNFWIPAIVVIASQRLSYLWVERGGPPFYLFY